MNIKGYTKMCSDQVQTIKTYVKEHVKTPPPAIFFCSIWKKENSVLTRRRVYFPLTVTNNWAGVASYTVEICIFPQQCLKRLCESFIQSDSVSFQVSAVILSYTVQ
jgi:hypothetical protein